MGKYFTQDDQLDIVMEIDMENKNGKVECERSTELTPTRMRCTWHRQTECYATLMLMPGITPEYLQSMIDLERVVVDDPDVDGDGYLYCFGGGKTYSELALARIVALEQDSTDDPGSFVLSQETDDLSQYNGMRRENSLTSLLQEGKGNVIPPEKPALASSDQAYHKEPDDNVGTGRVMDRFDRMYWWSPRERAMFRAGDAVKKYVGGRPFPTNNHLENAVWETQLRGKISRKDFREVCDNLRHRCSVIGDC